MKNHLDWTALAIAACFGDTEIVKILIEAKAKITRVASNFATVNGHTDIVEILKSALKTQKTNKGLKNIANKPVREFYVVPNLKPGATLWFCKKRNRSR